MIYQNDEERRFVSTNGGVQLAYRDKKPAMVVGFIPYNVESSLISANGRTFREIVKPTAFLISLRTGEDVTCRVHHKELVGRVSNGTLRLRNTPTGLHYECDIPPTQKARDAAKLIARGDVPSSSFSFRVRPDGEKWRRQYGSDGIEDVRELHSVILTEVNPVALPAYPQTYVSLREKCGEMDLMNCRLRLMEAEQSLAEDRH